MKERLSHWLNKIIVYLGKSFGYEVYIYKLFKSDKKEYERIFPLSLYSPWNIDFEFEENYNKIKNHTLVDKYRCFELWQIIHQISRLKGDYLEVGVWRGGTSVLGASLASKLDPNSIFFSCDNFEGVVKVSEFDSAYKGGEHSDTSIEIVNELIKNRELDNICILIGIFPEETGKLIESKLFKYCHIDVDSYLSGKDILNWIIPRLVIGGVIIFDDYGFGDTIGITRLVNEHIDSDNFVFIYNLNGHGLLIRIK